MVYLKSFSLTSISQEEQFLNNFAHTCFDSYYPFMLFPNKRLESVEFDHITIFCGGNGSGKSTLLNIIAEKLQFKRETPYNKTYFFDSYLQTCDFWLNLKNESELRDLRRVSKIITSDDVFNHIIEVRKRNENLDFKRRVIFDEKHDMNKYGYSFPRGFNADDPESTKNYINFYNKAKKSASSYVRRNVGVDERTYSNGENGFKYFTDAIQPGGLYLLDEPENSLSAEMQLELAQFIQGMARFYDCQFILSSHSPFILSIPYARIYNMDSEPVATCKWTELPNVRIFHDFFKEHSSEFA